MRHKELVDSIAKKIDVESQEAEKMLQTTIDTVKSLLVDGNTVHFQSFGSFNFRRREERVTVHPATQERTLIPPKQVAYFRPSVNLRNKLKEGLSHE